MSIKVLVADDSVTIQKVIGIIFGGDEYSLTVVDNGKAAVDKARESPGCTGKQPSCQDRRPPRDVRRCSPAWKTRRRRVPGGSIRSRRMRLSVTICQVVLEWIPASSWDASAALRA